jgi:predicted dienelactone hydrolase
MPTGSSPLRGLTYAAAAVALSVSASGPFRVHTFSFVDRTRTIVLPNGTREARPIRTVVRFPESSGRHPLIVFAHGYALLPATYSRLLDAWARAGYVVASPIFPLTSADAPRLDESDLINQPRDVSFVISRLIALSARHDGVLAGKIDSTRIAVAGQSDGGVTALAAAYDQRFRDSRIRAAIVMSGARLGGMGAFPQRGPPLLALQGTADTINAPATTGAYFSVARRPKYLVWLLGAGHLPPYTTEEPQLEVVERVTLAFLGHYLLQRPLSVFLDAARRPGITRFVSEP